MIPWRSRVDAFGFILLCASAAAPQNIQEGLERGSKMCLDPASPLDRKN
jgi:hypothetical protein